MARIGLLHRPPVVRAPSSAARPPHLRLTTLLVAAVLMLTGSLFTVVAVGFWVTATSVTATVIGVVDGEDNLVVRWTDPRTGEDRTNRIMGYDDEIELVERLALAGPLEGELVEPLDLGLWTAAGLIMLASGAGLGRRWVVYRDGPPSRGQAHRRTRGGAAGAVSAGSGTSGADWGGGWFSGGGWFGGGDCCGGDGGGGDGGC